MYARVAALDGCLVSGGERGHRSLAWRDGYVSAEDGITTAAMWAERSPVASPETIVGGSGGNAGPPSPVGVVIGDTYEVVDVEEARDGNVGTGMDDDGQRDGDGDNVEHALSLGDAGFEDQQAVDDRGEALGPEPGRGQSFPPRQSSADQRHGTPAKPSSPSRGERRFGGPIGTSGFVAAHCGEHDISQVRFLDSQRAGGGVTALGTSVDKPAGRGCNRSWVTAARCKAPRRGGNQAAVS
jgi:hypothetical protein